MMLFSACVCVQRDLESSDWDAELGLNGIKSEGKRGLGQSTLLQT